MSTETITQYLPFIIGALVLIWLITRRKKGKSGQPKAGGKIKATKRVVLTTPTSRKVMSVASHNGKLAAGTYDLGGPVYVYHDGKRTEIKAKESVHRLRSFGDLLIASCEKIQRVVNGVTGATLSTGDKYMVTDTNKLLGKFVTASTPSFTKPSPIYIRVHGDKIKQISPNGKWFCRDVFEMNGKAYLLAFDYDNTEGGVFESADLKTWTWKPIFGNKRPMRQAAYKGRSVISYSEYENGKRLAAGVLDLQHDLSWKDLDRDTGHGGAFELVVHNGSVYYTTLNWKGGGNATIRSNQDGEFKTFVTFDEPEALGLAVSPAGTLWAGVGGEGHVGKVYEIGGDDTQPNQDDAQDPRSIKGGFVWKPVSEGDGKLVVLLPASYNDNAIKVNGEVGRYAGRTNGNRPTHRFTKAGAGYPPNSILEVNGVKYLIANPSQRIG